MAKKTIKKSDAKLGIDKKFFSDNRRRLLKAMETDSIALLGGNHPLHTNGDGVLPYIPNHDLWYFTGIDQDETLLLLIKTRGGYEEILFIQPRNSILETWDGHRLSPEQARSLSGVEKVLTSDGWEDFLKRVVVGVSNLYFNLLEHPRAPFYRNRNHDLYDHCRKYFPLHNYKRLAPLISSLRMVKHPAEVAEIKQATAVTKEALERILPLLVAGNSEKDIEAEMVAIHTRHGGSAFSPIVASGANSCTLHYISNRDRLKPGGVVLIDSGSRGGTTRKYPADITRVFPIRDNQSKNKKAEFTPLQRRIYEGVLRVLKGTSALVRPGVKIKDYQEKSLKLMRQELLSLGLLKKQDLKDPDAHVKYYMHGVSHWLGLDVHDVGGYEGVFTEGMVLTCEPGIYVVAEGVGVRLENNLWIKSQHETENLSATIPLEVEDVYRWMGNV